MLLNNLFVSTTKLSNYIGAVFLSLFLVACGGEGGEDNGSTQYTLTVTVNDNGIGGNVTSDDTNINCGDDCTQSYDSGTAVTLTALSQEGYAFSGWSGACSGSSVCEITMEQTQQVGATFEQQQTSKNYSLVVERLEGGTITSQSGEINCGENCSHTYAEGSIVLLTAIPDEDYSFEGWENDCTGTSGCELVMTENRQAKGNFSRKRYTLAVMNNGGGSIISEPAGINCGSDCSEMFYKNTNITLTADPAPGYIFNGWNGDCVGTAPTCQIKMSRNKGASASFIPITPPSDYTLSVSATAGGIVTSQPGGINCGSDCSENYVEDTIVTLTAIPAEGYAFSGWSGSCSGTATCQLTMGQNLQVAATFAAIAPSQYSLNVTATTGGSVVSNPAGINCGNDCSETYLENTQVTLTATPINGYEFIGWSGNCSGTTTCQLTMSQSRQAVATFSEIPPAQYNLSVTTTTGGTVSSTPEGINCGSDCAQNYEESTSVTLTATAESGYEFSGWSGDCSGTAACQLSMTQNRQATATFTEIPIQEHTLTITAGNGGTVTSQPAGIDCGSDCSQNYEENTSVTLTATAESGYEFSGWSGDCSGTAACQLSMTQNRQATATFTEIVPQEYTLSISTNTGGTVTSQPNGVDCGSDCSENYQENTSVTLTATPAQGYEFNGWTGDGCSGKDPCALTMNSDKMVTATFSASSGALSIADMGLHEVDHGDVFQYQPQISGNVTICRKDMGHDDVKVDSETGAITWDTNGLTFGRGFHIRIKCSNYTESVYASMVVHIDMSGSSQLLVAGENGVSPYIGVAGKAMTSGDTIVFPDGVYPVSVAGDKTYENAFKRSAPTSGSANQFSTLIARSPGGAVISGTANQNIGKQKNAFELDNIAYVALVGFQIENVQRSSVTSIGTINRLLLDFVGAAGAGTWGFPCSNFEEADAGQCSNAGMRLNDGNPVFQNSYDWGHNRYGIMTHGTSGSITRRSFVRLDEHKGDQPYGGFSNYCDSAHLSQDNTVFDSLAIAAPHYKNYAGLEAYPATGCEYDDATLKTEGLLAVNNDLSLSLMDQKAGPVHVWDHIVSYDSVGTCTPQTGYCANLLLQADKETHVFNSFFGLAESFNQTRDAFDGNDVVLDPASVAKKDVEGESDVGDMPEYLPESLLYFRGRSDTFYGDSNYDQLTNVRRWPIGGEDIIAAKMRSYDNPEALKVGGGTIHISGNRGATANGESMSEYFWGYINPNIPPLVVRVKDKGQVNRVAWEHLSGSRRDAVTGWKVICVSSGNTLLATLGKTELVYNHSGSCSGYAVKALYADGESGIAYTESPQ
ncbi:InlB B-repeat-containing protein [Aliikangiella coralliicola]|uniref:Bacterial repeat domain-containing protein n=1 Tax=Aliikangiella coralliicola TaxID=2592383 RepID=A0A545UCD3_9GAMM|nr:InlB B-repeat-containing protein [Aliikangiella coralliicola]TQV87083.1 hypothetical protein FLL46_14860 [Aliikangiella coralliicola]